MRELAGAVMGRATATPEPPGWRLPPRGVEGAARAMQGLPLRAARVTGVQRRDWIGIPIAMAPDAVVGVLIIPGQPAHAVKERTPHWLAECYRRLAELQQLPEDWDSYGAAPPNDFAISLARKVLKRLHIVGLPAPHISPSAEDGVCMSFRKGGLYADIECFNSGEMLAATSDGEGDQHVWEVDHGLPNIVAAASLIGSRFNHRNM